MRMKIFVVLCALAADRVAAKSWNGDNYPDDTLSVLGWISYLKRLLLLTLMLSGVVLYYIPESRSHARKACCIVIDFVANTLKSALSATESEFMYEKIRSKYERSEEYQKSSSTRVADQLSEETCDDDGYSDYERARKRRDNRLIVNTTDTRLRRKEERRRLRSKQEERRMRTHRHGRQRHRSVIVKDAPSESFIGISPSKRLHSNEIEDKQLRLRFRDVKEFDESVTEDYAFLISGSPRQMAMIDHKYEKDDVVILHECHPKASLRECGTSVNKLGNAKSSKSEENVTYSDQEGPTRDNDDSMAGMESSSYKETELNSSPETHKEKYMQLELERQINNEHDQSSKQVLDDWRVRSAAPLKRLPENRNNTVSCRRKESIGDNMLSRPRNNYISKGDHFLKYISSVQRKHWNHKSNLPNSDITRLYNDNLADREVEGDHNNSQHGRWLTARHDLDGRPQRESRVTLGDSDMMLIDENYEDVPIITNRVKPALLRAVNWFFGGCPGQSKCCEEKEEVEKKEPAEVANEWLL